MSFVLNASSDASVQEMYRQGGQQFKEELQRHPLRPTQVRTSPLGPKVKFVKIPFSCIRSGPQSPSFRDIHFWNCKFSCVSAP